LSLGIVVVTRKNISNRNAISAIDPEFTSAGGLCFPFAITL
jgi:hypothetical protein